jgi:hypothetical protein
MTIEQLLTLARVYSEMTGLSLREIGRAACNGNHKFLVRLENGEGANIRSIERAAAWLADNWPAAEPWPVGVPRPRAAA